MENEWARSCVGIPAVRGSATVRRMEELGVLLAGPTDHLLLDRPLDGATGATRKGPAWTLRPS
ncbi:hypothetical protein [Streptomyces sp. NPDC014744]|uniref:hypothetical protein n=1 Tax=Streptomyces sp. NPDC014744 TaxID=3364903 RepID=UPI0036F87B3C